MSDYFGQFIGDQALYLFDQAAEKGGFVLLCQGCREPFPYGGRWGARIPAYCQAHCKQTARNARRRKRGATSDCLRCGDSFTSRRSDAVYCSNACRQQAYRARLHLDVPDLEQVAVTAGAEP